MLNKSFEQVTKDKYVAAKISFERGSESCKKERLFQYGPIARSLNHCTLLVPLVETGEERYQILLFINVFGNV
jgi:hypothetical protein